MSAAGYDVVEALGREHREIAHLKARIAELEKAIQWPFDYCGHGWDCSMFGDRGDGDKACDCWKADARRLLEKEER
jgi:hypothetical protein